MVYNKAGGLFKILGGVVGGIGGFIMGGLPGAVGGVKVGGTLGGTIEGKKTSTTTTPTPSIPMTPSHLTIQPIQKTENPITKYLPFIVLGLIGYFLIKK